MDSLPPLAGHKELRRRLADAVRRGRVPPALLLYGPPGVGKERLALWLAQQLLCDAPAEEPCGACWACRQVPRLQHPDVHWYFPLSRPEATGDRLEARLEEARANELERFRRQPYYVPVHDRPVAHYLAAMQMLRRRATQPPARGRWTIVVLGDAEFLAPQEATTEAANALLKLLEEPPAHTRLVLTARHPEALLPTIRSRLVAVRVPPWPEAEVERFLREAVGWPPDRARAGAARSGGAPGIALRLAAADEPISHGQLRGQARAWLAAAVLEESVPRWAAALAMPPGMNRDSLAVAFDAFLVWVRDLLVLRLDPTAPLLDPEAREAWLDLLRRRPLPPLAWARAAEIIAEARRQLTRNVYPPLLVAVTLDALHRALRAS